MFRVPELVRVRKGLLASTESNGNNGAFLLAAKKSTRALSCLVSDGGGWEHVSVKAHPSGSGGSASAAVVPTWQEMCRVKRIFWEAEDVTMQLHPKESEYVNNHPGVLHLWRPQAETGVLIPEPPTSFVGVPASVDDNCP